METTATAAGLERVRAEIARACRDAGRDVGGRDAGGGVEDVSA